MSLVKRSAAIVALVAFSLGAVRYYLLSEARSTASATVRELGGRMSSLTPPIPLSGSEYYVAFQDREFSRDELDRLSSALKSLAELNYVTLKFVNPPLSEAERRRIEQLLPGVRFYRDRATEPR